MSQEIDRLVAWLRERVPAGAGLSADSRRLRSGDVFLALPGASHDGRRHIPAALAAGAGAVLWEPEGHVWCDGDAIPRFAVPGLKTLAARLAAAWWGDPSAQLNMVGITGTNGKTSCSHWLTDALGHLGRPAAVIGTLGNGVPGALEATGHTTPDAVTLQGLLARYRDADLRHVVMEVSSHALDQGRVEGVHYRVAALTNLTQDHLDYHGDMAAYAQAKARLFAWPGLEWAILNSEDDLGRSLLRDLAGGRVRTLGYGLETGDLRGEDLHLSGEGLRMRVATPWGTGELVSPLLGRFNASNLLACLGVLLALGIPLGDALVVLGRVEPVAGRMQRIAGGPGKPTVIVDFAHTPDALDKTLSTLRPLVAGRLTCVFGCGGGRDRGKRPVMGGVVAARADRAIVTSDNPRNESPEHIIADILAGMPPGQTALVDRGEAIRRAITEAAPGDLVLIAGKGHENYQEIQGVRHPFADGEVAARALADYREEKHASA